MANCGVKMLVISSSATVCGETQFLPLTEHPLSATNPYGGTKLVVEEILRDVYRSDAILAYRYPALLQSGGEGGGAQAEAFRLS